MRLLLLISSCAAALLLAACLEPITYSPTVNVHCDAWVQTPNGPNHTEAVADGSSLADVDAESSASLTNAASHIHRGHPVTNNFVVGFFSAVVTYLTLHFGGVAP